MSFFFLYEHFLKILSLIFFKKYTTLYDKTIKSYSCSVSGSLSYLLEKIPVFGMLLFVGGLGWATLKLYQNKTANNSSKLA